MPITATKKSTNKTAPPIKSIFAVFEVAIELNSWNSLLKLTTHYYAEIKKRFIDNAICAVRHKAGKLGLPNPIRQTADQAQFSFAGLITSQTIKFTAPRAFGLTSINFKPDFTANFAVSRLK